MGLRAHHHKIMKKEKGRKWDGKSRVSNDLYRERFDEIFGKRKMVTVKKENNITIEIEECLLEKEKTVSELLEEGFEQEQAEYLKELKDKL